MAYPTVVHFTQNRFGLFQPVTHVKFQSFIEDSPMCTVPTEHTLAAAGQHGLIIFCYFGDFTMFFLGCFTVYLLHLYCNITLYKCSGHLCPNFQ